MNIMNLCMVPEEMLTGKAELVVQQFNSEINTMPTFWVFHIKKNFIICISVK